MNESGGGPFPPPLTPQNFFFESSRSAYQGYHFSHFTGDIVSFYRGNCYITFTVTEMYNGMISSHFTCKLAN